LVQRTPAWVTVGLQRNKRLKKRVRKIILRNNFIDIFNLLKI